MATYNLSGINTNNISKMKTAISNFKKTLTIATNINASNGVIQRAVKGTNVEAQIRLLSNNINAKVINMFNELDAFNTALDSVAAAYKKQDTSATAVGDVAGSIKS
ncbi:MAG: hypothetical protein HFJ02_03005 [Bacilli bacterium]|nr:hypothetical protein [Bacilli bacterium]